MRKSMWPAAALLAFAVTVPAAAQEDSNLTGVAPSLAPQSSEPQDFGAFGSGVQELWIAAPAFTGKLSVTSPDLEYDNNHYYNAPGAAGAPGYFAQVPLPSGAQIQSIVCHVRDASVTTDVSFSFQKFNHNTATNTPSQVFLLPFASSGSSGYQQPSLTLTAAQGAIRYTVGDDHYLYYIRANVADDTSFRGCNVRWNRTVAPAPAVASFPNDVPTTHPFFRFVEAMAASGLTGGCVAGSFCPDTAVTRGQLAVFLSVALGLHFPQ